MIKAVADGSNFLMGWNFPHWRSISIGWKAVCWRCTTARLRASSRILELYNRPLPILWFMGPFLIPHSCYLGSTKESRRRKYLLISCPQLTEQTPKNTTNKCFNLKVAFCFNIRIYINIMIILLQYNDKWKCIWKSLCILFFSLLDNKIVSCVVFPVLCCSSSYAHYYRYWEPNPEFFIASHMIVLLALCVVNMP